jgi:hypothetical protein
MAGVRRYTDEDKRVAVALIVVERRTAVSVCRELGIGTGTLRRWVREHHAREWARQVDAHFGWLTEHGFALVEADASWFWTWTVVYRKGTGAVLVVQDRECFCVELELVRAAVDVPLARRWIHVDGEITGAAYGHKLVRLRAPDPEALLGRVKGLGLTPDAMDTQLAFWAGMLRTYGTDVLAGDLAILDAPDPVVRRR